MIKSGRCRASNLHAVWDHCIVKRVILRYAGTVDAETVGVKTVDTDKVGKFGGAISAGRAIASALSPASVQQWQNADLAQWANESFAIAKLPETQYCFQTDQGCAYEPWNFSWDQGENKRLIKMTDEYLERFVETGRVQLAKAGVRLAGLLERALGGE